MFERIFKDKRATTKVSFAVLSIFILLFSIVMIVADVPPTITTDKEDYASGEIVWISGEGFASNTILSVTVTDPNDENDLCDSNSCAENFFNGTLTSDENGEFQYYPYLLIDGIEDEYSIIVSDGQKTNEITFTDTYPNINTICQNEGFDFGIEMFNCKSTTPQNNNPDYNIGISWTTIQSPYQNFCKAVSWTAIPNVAGVVSLEDMFIHPYSSNEFDHSGGNSGSFSRNNNQDTMGWKINSVVFCGNNEETPECITDADCDDLNQNSCNGDNWVHQTGECNQGVCVAASSTASCNDGLFCNGAETCEGAGICTNPTDIVCDSPSSSCYLSQGSCNEDTDSCDYTFSDTTGPVTSLLTVTKVIGSCNVKIEATETDTCSNIASAEYFIDGASCGPAGTGIPMDVKDGSWDSLIEQIIKNNAGTSLTEGSHNIYVRGIDAAGKWGDCVGKNIALDCLPPDYPNCQIGNTNPNAGNPNGVLINSQCNPDELLVCGTNPTLSANICDKQSKIQLAEYFVDEDNPLDWNGIEMNALDGTWEDENCEDVTSTIDLSLLSEGTHYVELHGKDAQETWGKMNDGTNPVVSFIKDTRNPITTKTLNPAEGMQVGCQIDNPVNGHTITDGCAYVKQGTTITLHAEDPDTPDHEHAGNVVIYYNVYWRLTEEDVWTLDQSGQSGVNQDAIITLSKDSYHLIEYWAVDGCGWAEDHHYELDIVDTQAPETEEIITGPEYTVEEGKTYLDRATSISLSCEDQQPHPVNQVTLHAKYNVDGGEWIEIPTDGGDAIFGFPEESHHVLEYYCVDALGNTEATHSEDYYVDHTQPATILTFGTPFVQSEGYAKWITSQTPITLTATDNSQYPQCQSGVKETKYRVTLMEDNTACWTPSSGCDAYEGTGEFLTYSTPFTIGEDSCHLIEYYSKDNVDKTEITKKECVFVDNKAPIFNEKYVGEPKVGASGNYDWYVTQDTQICVSAFDQEPHPVNGVSISCDVEQWDTDETQTSEPDNEYAVTLDGNGCFSYNEDSYHKLTCTATDALGNSATLIEKDIVDTLAPETDKVVGLPQYPNGENLFVTSDTQITFTCTDQTPHPVENEKVCFKVGYDIAPLDRTLGYCEKYSGQMEEDYCCVSATSPFEFHFNTQEDSSHTLEYYCEDGLGNKEKSQIEYDDVDDTAPWIIVHNPTLSEAANVTRCTQSVVIEAGDIKSGLNESTIYAELLNSEQQVVEHVALNKSVYGTYEALMSKQHPVGHYTLKICASDNLGNEDCSSVSEYLPETVTVEYINPSACTVDPINGGECDFAFNVCMRGGNSVQLWMDKFGDIVTPNMMDATINDTEAETYVGLKHEGFESPAGILQLISQCSDINGKEAFSLHLNITSEVAQTIGPGIHDLEYWIKTSLQCSEEELY